MWMGYGLGIHQDMGTREKLTFAVVYIFVWTFIYLRDTEFGDELNKKFVDQSFYHCNVGRGN